MSVLFHTIGLIGKHHDPGVADTLENLIADLDRRGHEVLLDESAAAYFDQPNETVLGREQLAERCDLVIVVGGDGTMLNAARSLAEDRHVEIRRYDVIYKVTDDIRATLEGKLKPEERVIELGQAVVKQVFGISKIGFLLIKHGLSTFCYRNIVIWP